MTIKLYPGRAAEKTGSVLRYLSRRGIPFELAVSPLPMHLHRNGDFPVLERDGKFFINPNEPALDRILRG